MSNEFDLAAEVRASTIDRLEKILQVVQIFRDNSNNNDNNKSGVIGEHNHSVVTTTTTSTTVTTFQCGEERLALRRLHQEEYETLQTMGRNKLGGNHDVDIFQLTHQDEINNRHNLEEYISDTRLEGWIVLDFSKDTTTTTITKKEDIDTTTPTDTPTLQEDTFSLLAPGIHSNTLISDSIINIQTCRVYRNILITNAYIGSYAIVLNCGQILGPSDKNKPFGCGSLNITVGAESGGGRDLVLTAEAIMNDVTQQLQPTIILSSTTTTTISSTSAQKVPLTVIADRALVRDTPTIRNVFMYPGSSIEAASSVKDVVLFPMAKITNASIVSNALMQWNTSITDHSHVHHVMMMEQSHCGPSSIVHSTVMGPDTHASAGEIHASIIGPNTNAHHQSLLIGVLWPLGRGNVGYGANVGSNHTGRLPDQETTVGEGIFWGLSCIVKFPIDLTWAPYSIIAAGITVYPSQRICMPFSLIVNSTGDTNEIIPGWVLQSSPYTLVRNDQKYKSRRKAIRHSFYTGWPIFRPTIIDMCRAARNALTLSLEGERSSLEKMLSGIGTNMVVTERGHKVGIQAYTECIQRYVLGGLLTWIIETMKHNDSSENMTSILQHEFGDKTTTRHDENLEEENYVSPRWPTFPWDPQELSMKEWEYQRDVLLEEFPIDPTTTNILHWLKDLLDRYVNLEQDFASRVGKSKARDDWKGTATIPGYIDSHVTFENDPMVVQVQNTARDIEDTVISLLERIQE